MVKVSIICLIYKSARLSDWVYESIINYTPMIKRGEAEFFFVANDPTDAVINHLIEKNYPFILNENKIFSEEELFAQGYGIPEYMNRVYKGYNQGILHAKGERVVLINSDNYFSPDWLENLLKYSTFKNIVCSELVEPGHEKFLFFPTALRGNFGKTIENFEKEKFINYVMRNKKTGLKKGGAYMPCILYKDMAIYAGLYPEGNIAGDDYETVIRYGDEYFYDNLKKLGVEHCTAMDSFAYHLKEGEKDDEEYSKIKLDEKIKSKYRVKNYNKYIAPNPYNINVYLVSSSTYASVMDTLDSNSFHIEKENALIQENENLKNTINNQLADTNNRLEDTNNRLEDTNNRLYDEIRTADNKLEETKYNVNWIKLFGIYNNRERLKIVIFGISIVLKINEKNINKIAWWIPIKKWRDNFRNKF